MGEYQAVYHTTEREWYLWNGHEAIYSDTGTLRLFLTAAKAYEWLAANTPNERTHP